MWSYQCGGLNSVLTNRALVVIFVQVFSGQTIRGDAAPTDFWLRKQSPQSRHVSTDQFQRCLISYRTNFIFYAVIALDIDVRHSFKTKSPLLFDDVGAIFYYKYVRILFLVKLVKIMHIARDLVFISSKANYRFMDHAATTVTEFSS